jgi:transposase
MTDLAQLTSWCKKLRAVLKQQLDMLESGQMRTIEERGTEAQADTTADTVQRLIRQINELNDLLAEEDEAEVEEKAKGQLPSAI